MKTLSSQALDAILPPRCPVSGEAVESQGTVSPAAWSALDFIHDPLCGTCGFPFPYETEPGMLCGACLADPPPFETARAALIYNDGSRDLILGFKHADRTYAVTAFMPWMARAGADMLAQADALIPVPLHRWRLLKRRYNQAGLIAAALAKSGGTPLWSDAMMRTRSTPPQGHLAARERHENVRKAFAVSPRYAQKIKGKRLILVDDVYTTGATVRECAQVLRKSGAGAVHVLTLARVVKAGY
ncbi:MAG: ComF family protein [Alphaproteobacteria bacterium]|nr:ComF family protein [Alphaproteobacteria bacterium]